MSKKLNALLVLLAIILLVTPSSKAQTISVFSAVSIYDDPLDLDDGAVDSLWSNVTSSYNVSEFGSSGYAKFANNMTHLQVLFVLPKNNRWVSMQMTNSLETANNMQNGADAWTFYIDQTDHQVTAEDQTFNGLGPVSVDSVNDLHAEGIVVDDMIYIEAMRHFNTSESSDYQFTNGSIVYVLFAAETTDQGHTSLDPEAYAILVSVSEPGSDPIDIDPPVIVDTRVDYGPIKDTLFILTGIAIGGFILLHFSFRILIWPLKKWDRIIDSDEYKAPSFKERINEIKEDDI